MTTSIRALCLPVSLAIVLGGSVASAAEMDRLVVVEHATTDATTDTGAMGDTAGDVLTFANKVYDESNAKMVGTDNGWCVRTVVGTVYECFWILSLADGQITVEGPFLDDSNSTLAVTGGTGAYAGVRGEMKVHSRNFNNTEFDFVYMLIR